jgi:Eisosome component PIL1
LKQAYDIHFAAAIERAEKSLLLAKYGRRVLNYLDDAPVVPGDERQPFAYENEVKQILSDAEQDIQSWQPNLEPVQTSVGSLGTNAMPTEEPDNLRSPTSAQSEQFEDTTTLHHPDDISASAGEPAAEKKSSHQLVIS